MAYISIARRTEACLFQLRNNGDTDATVKYILREFADEPAMQQAKNKEKLATNIITMGGTGLNRDANITAMRQAIDIYVEEEHRKVIAKLEQEKESLRNDLERERNAKYDLERDYRQQVTRAQELNDKMLMASSA